MQQTMTSRERVEVATAHREPDRTPVFEYVLLSPVADKLLGRAYAGDLANWPALVGEVGWEEAVRRNAADRLDLACMLGHDLLYVTPNPLPPGPSVASPSPGPVSCTDPVEQVRRRNVRSVEAGPERPAAALAVYRALKELMCERELDLPILAPAYAHGVWTDVDLMQTMLLEPEVAAEHFRLATERSLWVVDRYAEIGIDFVGVGGDFAGNRPLISPELYREFIVSGVREVSRRAHAHGAKTVNASDGNLWSVIDDFLIGCEVDGYLEIDLHAGMDLARLKKAYGDRITFFGNLDCGNTLSFGAVDDIRTHVVECLEAGQGNGGHVLCASNAITASVSFENYCAVVSAYRDFFGLPRVF